MSVPDSLAAAKLQLRREAWRHLMPDDGSQRVKAGKPRRQVDHIGVTPRKFISSPGIKYESLFLECKLKLGLRLSHEFLLH
jgi:hypothetical protein